MKMIERNLPSNMKLRVHHQHTDGGKLDATVAVVYDRDSGDVLGMGRALVNHRKEKSPSRKIGRAVAVGRAMQQALGRKSRAYGGFLNESEKQQIRDRLHAMREESHIDWTAFISGESV